MFQPVTGFRKVQLACIAILSLSLIACGSVDSDPASPLRTGVFLDSAPVEGLGFTTETMSGNTNVDGEFTYNAGERITFSLGGLALPTVPAASTMTSRDLFEDDESAAADLSRLLQSMDEDGMPEDFISLPLNVESITSDTQIEFGGPDFDSQAQTLLSQVNDSQAILIGSETATASVDMALEVNGLVASEECTAEHPYVGRSLELSDLSFHGVSGTVTVINDCEMEVTNFNYDGGGPSVYFYAAVDRAYSSNFFIIGPMLSGTRWVDDTIRLPLPEGRTFDDFNSMSVWCRDFNANFGEVLFDQ